MKKSIVVEIFETDLKNLTQITKVLQDNNLLIDSNIISINSSYLKNNLLSTKKEYKLEFITQEALFEKISLIIYNISNSKDIKIFWQDLNNYEKLNYLNCNSKKINDKNDKITKARMFCDDVKKISKIYDLPFFIVTDGASVILNNGCAAVRNARENHIKWEKENGYDPNHEW